MANANGKFNVKVKGPRAGYRSIGQFFSENERIIEVTAEQLKELHEEKILLVIDLPDDYNMTVAAPIREPTAKDAIQKASDLEGRIATVESMLTDLGGEVAELQEKLAAAAAEKSPAKELTSRIKTLEGQVADLTAKLASTSAASSSSSPAPATGK